MNPSLYVLDANVFIEAAKRYYAFDLVPSFWNHLVRYAKGGHIISIDRIGKELKWPDALNTWARTEFAGAFATTDDASVISSYSDVVNWVYGQSQYVDAAKAEFADEPDGWLVAYAISTSCTLVTQEVLAKDARKKIPIPNICLHFQVPFINTFEMMRLLGMRLA